MISSSKQSFDNLGQKDFNELLPSVAQSAADRKSVSIKNSLKHVNANEWVISSDDGKENFGHTKTGKPKGISTDPKAKEIKGFANDKVKFDNPETALIDMLLEVSPKSHK